MDHKRTWRFSVAARPDECVNAFANTFTKRAGLLNAHWSISRNGRGATATYEGRKGFTQIGTVFRQNQISEAIGIGSQISFDTAAGANGRTECVMELAKWGTRFLFFTQEVGLLRAYMRGVSKQLAALDSSLVIEKA